MTMRAEARERDHRSTLRCELSVYRSEVGCSGLERGMRLAVGVLVVAVVAVLRCCTCARTRWWLDGPDLARPERTVAGVSSQSAPEEPAWRRWSVWWLLGWVLLMRELADRRSWV